MVSWFTLTSEAEALKTWSMAALLASLRVVLRCVAVRPRPSPRRPDGPGSVLHENRGVDVINGAHRADGDVHADNAVGEVRLGGVDVHAEGRVLAVGAGHDRAVLL